MINSMIQLEEQVRLWNRSRRSKMHIDRYTVPGTPGGTPELLGGGNECCAGYNDFLLPIFPRLTFINPVIKQPVQFFDICFRYFFAFG